MKKLIFILITLSFFLGCKRDPMPRNAIPRDQFVNILVDVHIAESINTDRFRLKIDSVSSAALYLSVLEKYHVTKEQMLTTSLYYSRHQKEYKKVYTDVLDKISMMIEEGNNNQELKIKTDSVPPARVDEIRSLEK